MLTETQQTALMGLIRDMAENARGAHRDDPAGFPHRSWEDHIADQSAELRRSVRFAGMRETAEIAHRSTAILRTADECAVLAFLSLVGDTPALFPDRGIDADMNWGDNEIPIPPVDAAKVLRQLRGNFS